MTKPKSKKAQGARAARRHPASLACEVRGRTFAIEAASLDDWELIEVISALDGGGDQSAMLQLPAVLRRLLGAAQYAAAKDAVRDEAGRVSAEEMGEFVGELFMALDPNSSRSRRSTASTEGNLSPTSSASTEELLSD